jgi:steroid 5-alpha reductase family enzyme
MTAAYLEALFGLAMALSILIAVAWAVQQQSGNSGRVDTVLTPVVGPGGALWLGPHIAVRQTKEEVAP